MTDHAEKSREEQFAEYVESTDAAEREQAEQATASEAPEAVAPAAAEQPASAAQTAQPTDEPFPGFAALPADVQETLRKKLSATDEAEKKFNDLKRQNDAMQGRLAPTQRELDAARRKLQELERAGKPDPRQSVARLRDIDPDTHQAVHAVQEQLAHTEARLSQMQEFVERAQVREYETEQLAALRSVHPDVGEIAKSVEFNQWCATQPEKYQARLLAADAETTAAVLEDYKRDFAVAALLWEREQMQSQSHAKPATPKRGLAVDPNPSTRRSAVASAAGKTYASEREREFAEYMALNPEQS